jgi:hypothetical protein
LGQPVTAFSLGFTGTASSFRKTRAELARLCTEVFAEVLRIPFAQVQAGGPLVNLGVGSRAAIIVRERLSEVVGRELPTTLLLDYPTIDAFVDGHLGSTEGELDECANLLERSKAAHIGVNDLYKDAFALIHGWVATPLLLEFAKLVPLIEKKAQTICELAERTNAEVGPL